MKERYCHLGLSLRYFLLGYYLRLHRRSMYFRCALRRLLYV